MCKNGTRRTDLRPACRALDPYDGKQPTFLLIVARFTYRRQAGVLEVHMLHLQNVSRALPQLLELLQALYQQQSLEPNRSAQWIAVDVRM